MTSILNNVISIYISNKWTINYINCSRYRSIYICLGSWNNLYIDHLRKQKNETVSLHKHSPDIHRIIDEEPSPADLLIQQQNLAKLKAFIRKLKPHYQEVINLRYFQELSYKEISEKLNEPMSNIKVKLLRAKKLLAEIIKNK